MLGRHQVTDQAGAQSGQGHQGSPVPLPEEATHSRSGWAAKAGGDQQTVKESHWLAREGQGAGPGLSAPPAGPLPLHRRQGRRPWEEGAALQVRPVGGWHGDTTEEPQGWVAGALGCRWGVQSLEDTHPSGAAPEAGQGPPCWTVRRGTSPDVTSATEGPWERGCPSTRTLSVLPDWGTQKESRAVFPRQSLWVTSPAGGSAEKGNND